eukprot:GFUD01021813.1.p1 GENE.GFUD01021813.1~~GFUD01021813.1.p1  ORF type:complete len:324 (-),score=89.02 GFUD01021813.1:27-998(-)
MLLLGLVRLLLSLTHLAAVTGHSLPGGTRNGPNLNFQRRWKTKLQNFPLAYGSVSMARHNQTMYVLNGGDVGNYVEKFSMSGNYSGEYAGWYNWPSDLVAGGQGQLLVSALGAMGDDHMMAYGLVMYNKEGKFLHGFHQENTTLGRPFGLATLPGTDKVVVADWGKNRTVVLDVDWNKGNVSISRNLSLVPYPYRVAASKDRIVVISMVCCQPWQEKIKAMRLYDMNGKMVKEVKKLPDGSIINAPETVAMDTAGNIFLVDGTGGLNKTMFFDPEGNFVQDLPALGTPSKILVEGDKLFTLSGVVERGKEETYISVFSYSLFN